MEFRSRRAGVIVVTEPHEWPFEQSAEGSVRPWYLTATGYLVVLFSDPEEARRAERGLAERLSGEAVRLYQSEEILQIVDRLQGNVDRRQGGRSLVADAPAKQRFLDTPGCGAPPSG